MGLVLGSVVFYYRTEILAYSQTPRFTNQYIGINGLYNTDNLPEDIYYQISYGLTSLDTDDKPQPSPLIDSIVSQNDNKDFIVTLKPNFYWHDSKKFTNTDLPYKFDGITITPIGNNQVKFSSDAPFAPIYTLLSQPLLKKNLVGLGPYKVTSISYQDGYIKTLTLRNIKNQEPNIVYRFYSNEKDLINAFKLGEVDQIEISSLPAELTNWPKTELTQKIMTGNKYLAVFLNNSRLGSKQLRQALAYATPKSRDKNERSIGPISPGSWAYNPDVKPYEYNPEKAKELFDKNPVSSLTINIIDRNLLPIAESIRDSWKQVLNIDTKVVISNQFDTQNYDAILAYGGIPHDPDQYTFWHSTQTKTNLTQINNSRIDKLLEEGRLTFDPIERKRIYFDFQKYLLEESPAIFISYPTTYTVTRVK
ncbi:MAG TPA: ABC transporter substrate-binding protein [Patescibacteria group bacterium]